MAPETPIPATTSAQGERRGELTVEGVSKSFHSRRQTVHALDNITLHVRPGEFVCLVGPSGCGKSTLLDIIAGLTKADQGRVTADGLPVTGPERHRLVMFQEAALFPWLDALQLCDDIREIWRERGKTILLVTHNVREACCLGDRVVLLSPNPGRLRKVFEIPLPRSRDMNDSKLSGFAARITAELKGYYAAEAVL
jgi:ABC-type nitrate/sulfonate/bicarbonate transport system ATPase subunit